MFINSNTNKRYYTVDYFFKQKFGKKIAKISLDAGFTCPNIDGKCGVGGCTYCDSSVSAPLPLKQQYDIVKSQMKNKWNDIGTLLYFQAHTNTYAPLSKIKTMFEQALKFDSDIVGISIATRADCLEDDIVEYISELSRKIFVIVELGLQTIHESTAKYINRCHTFEQFLIGYNKLKQNGINVCVHLINGLPFETSQMMLESAITVAKLMPHSVKIHSLHIIDDTVMAGQYLNQEFTMQTLSEYTQTVCNQIEVFHQDTVIQRLTGDGIKDKLIAPLWSLDKRVVQNEIDKELARRDSYQGKYFDKY